MVKVLGEELSLETSIRLRFMFGPGKAGFRLKSWIRASRATFNPTSTVCRYNFYFIDETAGVRSMFGTTFDFFIINNRDWRSRSSDCLWHSHSERLEHLSAAAFSTAAHCDFFAMILNCHLLQSLDISFDIFPFEPLSGPIQRLLQLLAQNQRQKGTKNMAANRFIAFMEDRPGFQHRLHITEYPFNPNFAIAFLQINIIFYNLLNHKGLHLISSIALQ